MTEQIQHYRVELVADRVIHYECGQLTGPDEAAAALHHYLSTAVSERLVVAYLSGALRPTGIETVAMGGMSGAGCLPAEVFRGALLARAASIIVAHNHPSEDPTPSAADIEVTQSLVEAGKLLGIPVLDHFVCTHTCAHGIISGCTVSLPPPPTPGETNP